jgi:hypothetical protein
MLPPQQVQLLWQLLLHLRWQGRHLVVVVPVLQLHEQHVRLHADGPCQLVLWLLPPLQLPVRA